MKRLRRVLGEKIQEKIRNVVRVTVNSFLQLETFGDRTSKKNQVVDCPMLASSLSREDGHDMLKSNMFYPCLD